jgi:hypothetical protein
MLFHAPSPAAQTGAAGKTAQSKHALDSGAQQKQPSLRRSQRRSVNTRLF